MKWNNGIKYEGNFVHSTLCGFGLMTNLEGDKYEGYFDKNLMNGKGKYYYDNGDSYEEKKKKGKRRGKGVYTRNDGLIYDGEWVDDLMNGIGKIKIDNYLFKCIYKNGEIIDLGIYKNKNESEDNYNYLYNMISEFKPEESGFKIIFLSHLDYDNNIISQYGPAIIPSFIND